MKKLKEIPPETASFTPPSSSAIIEGNEDLLIEILVLLPAKSLHRFRSVSRLWRSLISDPSFGRRHTLHRHRDTQPLLIYGSCKSEYRVYNPRIPKTFSIEIRCSDFPWVQILQSCNGLLLLRCSKTKRDRSRYCIFNPTTKQQRELPPPPISNRVVAIYLMFDPCLSPHYRVVCFSPSTGNCFTSTLIYLYDSETHQWKQLGIKSHMVVTNFLNGIYFNGGICFLKSLFSYRFNPDDGNDDDMITDITGCHLLDFDLLHFPLLSWNQKSYIMECNEVLLFLTLFHSENKENMLYVSEMKKGSKNGWSNTNVYNMKPILGEGVSCVDAMRLLCVIMGERGGQDRMVVFRLDSKIMIYKFYDSVFDVVDQEFHDDDDPEWYVNQVAHQFTHTLAPV